MRLCSVVAPPFSVVVVVVADLRNLRLVAREEGDGGDWGTAAEQE
jgi:hypothetical protein